MTRFHLIQASLAAVALFSLAIAGCGPSTINFHGTPRAVGVDAKAEISDIEGGNREVRVELQHLPPPARLGSGLTVYALWIVPPSGAAQLAGFLEYNEGERKGTARATTPGRRFQLRITAERNRNVGAPSEFVVARTTVGG